jgi:hypothetical protein
MQIPPPPPTANARPYVISSPALQTTTTSISFTSNPTTIPTVPLQQGQNVQYPAASSIPPLQYDPIASRDPRFIPFLPDFSEGSIQLDGPNPGNTGHRPTRVIQKTPTIPFWPGSTATSAPPWGYDQSSAMFQFVSRFKPKIISTSVLQTSYGWNRLPQPSPAWVAIPGFGTSVVFYWLEDRQTVLAGRPTGLLYAVRKLTPLPLSSANTEYVGQFYCIFAGWVKPMKWAISQYPTQASADSSNVVFISDDGTEFRLPLDAVRNEYHKGDPRVRVAVNALIRDFPFLEQSFAFTPSLPPPEMLNSIAQYSSQTAQQYQNALSGNAPSFVNGAPGAAANYPGARIPVITPPPKETEEEEGEEEGEEEEGEAEEETTLPPTKPAGSIINLMDGVNQIRLRPWK